TVDLNTGGLRLSHALDFDLSPGTSVGGNPALVYDSRTVDVQPVVQVSLDDLGCAMGASTPTSFAAQLTWNGTTQAWQNFSASGWQMHQPFELAVEVANPVQTTGEYNWSMDIHVNFANNTYQDVTASGSAFVVSNVSSPYGAGWGIDGVNRLF